MTASAHNRQKYKKHKRKRRRLWLWGMTAVAFLLVLWGYAAEEQARVLPDYPQIDITEYLDKKELTKEEYTLLFKQTGLAPSGIAALYREGRQKELLVLQEKLFAEVPFTCRANTMITREEIIAEEDRSTDIPYVEEGDILITFNSHFLGWRNGHAAIVLDAGKELTLEASVLGSDTTVMSMEHWKKYPSFVVLRLKDADREERKAIAELAGEQLTGVPYRLTAGWGDWMYSAPGDSGQMSGSNGNKSTAGVQVSAEHGSNPVSDSFSNKAVAGTQCAHLVWYAYQQFGYDLDSDGGLVVTPRDLYESSMLEVVQVYGMRIVP